LQGLDAAQLELIASEAKVIGGPYQDADGLFAIDIERVEQDGRVKAVTVPSEEFLIAPFARDIASAPYVAHKPANVTRSDLVEMGFDPEVVEGLPAGRNRATATRPCRAAPRRVTAWTRAAT
jgi:hypothetical protein